MGDFFSLAHVQLSEFHLRVIDRCELPGESRSLLAAL